MDQLHSIFFNQYEENKQSQGKESFRVPDPRRRLLQGFQPPTLAPRSNDGHVPKPPVLQPDELQLTQHFAKRHVNSTQDGSHSSVNNSDQLLLTQVFPKRKNTFSQSRMATKVVAPSSESFLKEQDDFFGSDIFFEGSHSGHDEKSELAVPEPPGDFQLGASQTFRQPLHKTVERGEDHRRQISGMDTASAGQKSKFRMASSGQSARIGVVPPQFITPKRLSQQRFAPPARRSHATEVDQDDSLTLYSQPDLFESTQPISTPHTLTLPAMTPGGTDSGIMKLKSVSEIPEKYRPIFPFPYFNIVQSKVFDDVVYSDAPVVMCAPTGSGKTAIFELAIVRQLIKHNGALPTTSKVVYMAPMKALCSERLEDWQAKFGPQGLRCKELTGDTELDDFFELQDVHIVLTTPEKWDSMTRRWRDNHSLVHHVSLFLVDEVHLLNDDTRGATIEAVVSRMKTVQTAWSRSHRKDSTAVASSGDKIRFLAVSATIPNVEDVGKWLSMEHTPAVHYNMDDSCRPVRLRKVVLGFPHRQNSNEFQFDLSLNYKLASVIETYSEQKPTLVFCATRKGVQQAASTLVKEARFILNAQHKMRLQKNTNTLRDSKLRELVIHGVGFHHAGMDMQDRKAVEAMFTKGDLPVLIATSTLAMGVNLPAHLVVVKSTMHYVMGVYQEYQESQVLQMLGRAGRPQFDITATAVIMTRTQTKNKYEALLNGTQLVESSLHQNLVEHLNAEIVLGTITDITVALEWIRSTFLYIRVMKNPKHYGIPVGLTTEQVEKRLHELCLRNVNALAGADLVKMEEDGFVLRPSELGRQMARYCVAFDTMKQFQSVSGNESLGELLTIICTSKEFHDVQLRNNEKKTLNSLNKDKNKPTIRFPVQGKIKTNEMKVNCLIQAQLGCLPIQDFSLTQDISKINRSAVRISRCFMEVMWQSDNFKSLLNAVLLAKSIKAKLWENSKYVSRQLSGIGSILANALVNASITTFQKIEERNPRELELIVNRHPPFGNQLKEAVSMLPKYELCIDQSCVYSDMAAELTLSISIANVEQVQDKTHSCVLLVGDADNKILYKTKLSDAQLLRIGTWTKKLDVRRAGCGEELNINFVSMDMVGLDVQSSYAPFYTGPKRVSRTEQKTSALMTSAQRKQQRHEISMRTPVVNMPALAFTNDPSRRPCSHHCLNKQECAHDCCKYGVSRNIRTPKVSAIDSYRNQLKQRLPESLETQGVKRFKSEQSSLSGLQQFAYNVSGSRRQQLPRLPPIQHQPSYTSMCAVPPTLANSASGPTSLKTPVFAEPCFEYPEEANEFPSGDILDLQESLYCQNLSPKASRNNDSTIKTLDNEAAFWRRPKDDCDKGESQRYQNVAIMKERMSEEDVDLPNISASTGLYTRNHQRESRSDNTLNTTENKRKPHQECEDFWHGRNRGTIRKEINDPNDLNTECQYFQNDDVVVIEDELSEWDELNNRNVSKIIKPRPQIGGVNCSGVDQKNQGQNMCYTTATVYASHSLLHDANKNKSTPKITGKGSGEHTDNSSVKSNINTSQLKEGADFCIGELSDLGSDFDSDDGSQTFEIGSAKEESQPSLAINDVTKEYGDQYDQIIGKMGSIPFPKQGWGSMFVSKEKVQNNFGGDRESQLVKDAHNEHDDIFAGIF